MRGPMGKPKNRVENPGKLLKRLMDYISGIINFTAL